MTARKAAILERDGDACVWCGRTPWPRDLTLEHVLPRSRGGHATPENLAPACRRCNRARRSRPVASYVRELVAADRRPRVAALEAALDRLSRSTRAAERDYGARQLELLRRSPRAPNEPHPRGTRRAASSRL